MKNRKISKNHVDLARLEKEQMAADRNTNKRMYQLKPSDTANMERIDLSEFKKAVSLQAEELPDLAKEPSNAESALTAPA